MPIGTGHGEQFDSGVEMLMSKYPDSYEAAYARETGAAYGTRSEPFVEGNLAKVFGSKNKAESAGGLNLNKSFNQTVEPRSQSIGGPDFSKNTIGAKLRDVYGKAFLASRRSAISGLGFDPTVATLDVVSRGTNIGGAYDPEADKILSMVWADRKNSKQFDTEDSLVHESTHRGLQKLIEKSPEAAAIFREMSVGGANSEMITRWIMHSKMGDPEKGGGPGDDKQIKQAVGLFEESFIASHRKKQLQKLEDLAAKQIAKHKGPH